MIEKISRKEFLKAALVTNALTLMAFTDNSLPAPELKEKKLNVLGKKINYLTAGKGKTAIVFLHGNPTRAHIWRNIIPYASSFGLCIAPDLIGMGDSDKLDEETTGRYEFACHQRFLDAFLDKILSKTQSVILVGHDWGGVLSHDWARKNHTRVRGIVFMETFLEPNITGQTPEPVIQWFRNFRMDEFKSKVLNENHFIENIFFKSLPELPESDREIYRRPYKNKHDRLPTLIWPREVPIDKTPEFTHNVFLQNIDFMSQTDIPKLFISAEPGALLGHEARKNVIRQWPQLTEAKVKGNHYIQEQCPDDIGKALQHWLTTLKK